MSNKLELVMSSLLVKLDQKLEALNKEGKFGSAYWKRLRERKRLVQMILENYRKPWAEVWETFDGEFWKKELGDSEVKP